MEKDLQITIELLKNHDEETKGNMTEWFYESVIYGTETIIGFVENLKGDSLETLEELIGEESKNLRKLIAYFENK